MPLRHSVFCTKVFNGARLKISKSGDTARGFYEQFHLPDGDLLFVAHPDLLGDLIDEPEVVRDQLQQGTSHVRQVVNRYDPDCVENRAG